MPEMRAHTRPPLLGETVINPSRGPARVSAFALAVFLCLCASCATRRDFRAATEQDTVEAYSRFLQEHPEKSSYASLAKKRLEELSFQKARQQNTFEAYMNFLARFPLGRFAPEARQRAEDLRSAELGIHLYRAPPADFFEVVTSRALPFRIQVVSLNTDERERRHIEKKWYEELVRRGLFLPLDPAKVYSFSPDLTLKLRESTLDLCGNPYALVEAQVVARGRTVRSYRVAADRVEKYLLYEIYRDASSLRDILWIPREERKKVEEAFQRLKSAAPFKQTIVLECDLDQQSSHWDQEMVRAFVEFLKQVRLWERLLVYPRGSPESPNEGIRLFLRVDSNSHAPSLYRQWTPAGSGPDWTSWNSAWILEDQDYFFRKMTLDLAALLAEPEKPATRSPSPPVRIHRPIAP